MEILKNLYRFTLKVFFHVKWRVRFFFRIQLLQRIYAQLLSSRIQSGLFKGLRYLKNGTSGSVILPKLIGTYESELNRVFENLDFEKYDKFIDIGAAEGYYAVGLTAKFPVKQMIAFEATRKGRRKLKKLAKLNGVSHKIEINGFCDADALNNYLSFKEKNFIIVDVEGYEAELLNPEKLPLLRKTDLLVEMHPNQVSGIEQLLINRFSSTHEFQILERTLSKRLEFCHSPFIIKKWSYLTNEFRSSQSWIFLKTKS